MAATVRASTAATATNSPTSPASTEIGDLVLVFHFTRGTAGVPTHTLQSGFTEIRSHSHDDGSTDGRLSCAYKVATSAGANAYNAYTSSTGTDFAGIVVLTLNTWEQWDTALVGDVQTSVTTTTNAAPNPGSVSLPVAQCLVLVCAAWYLSASATVAVTPPANYSEVWEMAGSNTAEMSVAQRTLSASGTEDPGAFADDVAPSGTCSLTLCFRPRAIKIVGNQGSYTLTGQAVTLLQASTLALDQGSYALTGYDVGLTEGTSDTPIVCEQGSYTLTGQDVPLEWDQKVTAEQGSYALTGQDVGLRKDLRCVAAQGAYALTGYDVGLLWHQRIAVDQGSYALTGQSVILQRNVPIAAAQGAYALTGQDVGLEWDQRVAAEQGSYTLTGFDVPLAAGATMTAEQGSYALTGQDVTLRAPWRLVAANGTYALAGQDAGLSRGVRIAIEQGSYLVTGQDLTFAYAQRIVLEHGTYALTGLATVLDWSGGATNDVGRRGLGFGVEVLYP